MSTAELLASTARMIAFVSLTSFFGCRSSELDTGGAATDPKADLESLIAAGSVTVDGTISPATVEAGDEVTIIFDVSTPRATVLSVEVTVFDPMDRVAYYVPLGGRQVSPTEPFEFEDYFLVEPSDLPGTYRLAVDVIHTGTDTLLTGETSLATFTVESGIPFQIVSGLDLSATTLEPGDTLNGTVSYKNVSGAAISVHQIVIATRPPGGTHGGGPYLDMTPVLNNSTVQPQETVQLSASRTLAANDPVGMWEAYPTYKDADDVWHDGPSVFFTVETGGSSSGCNPTPPGATTSPFFINMEADCYWCSQPVFVDLVKAGECFRDGWSLCVNGQSTFATDSGGWPLVIPSSGIARSILGPVIRTGTYNVRWKGKGTFALRSFQAGTLAAPLVVNSTGDGMATAKQRPKGRS